jgi:ribosomal RNA-processing protein 12
MPLPRLIVPQQIAGAYAKVVELFRQNLAKSKPSTSSSMHVDDNGGVTAMTEDLILLLIPFLTSSSAKSLFELFISPQVLEDRSTGVQKRGYKILGKLIEKGTLDVDAGAVIQQLDGVSDGLAAAAKKVRIHHPS